MIIYLHEYNVVPSDNKKEQFIIKVEDNMVTYNNITKESNHIVDEIKKILISYKDTLLQIKDIKCSNYKGGRQKQLTIYCKEICEEQIILIGNTDKEEMVELYNEIKNKLISLLEN